MQTIIFGIPNCDTMKKARKWLTEHKIDYTFHDYRKDGVETAWLLHVSNAVGWELMINKRGTTFRQLPAEKKDNLDKEKALALMQAHPAMIKRPVLCHEDKYFVGFSSTQYEGVFA